MIGMLATLLGITGALLASLLPIPSLATFQLARAVQTNTMVPHTCQSQPHSPTNPAKGPLQIDRVHNPGLYNTSQPRPEAISPAHQG